MFSRAARILIVSLAGLGLILAACGRSDQDRALASGAAKPAPERLQARLLGNTLSSHNAAEGEVSHIHFAKDGSLRGVVASQYDTGRYRIDGEGRLCVLYTYLTNGEEFCAELVEKDGKFTFFDPDGKQLAVMTARPGDPEKLMERAATP